MCVQYLFRDMLTSEQIRAARSLLRWTAHDLAEKSGVSGRTIQRLETDTGVPASHSRNLEAVRRTLEQAGVVFIDQSEESGPGVKLRDPI
jgi:transcriptional regulator with XRE-family HTH domain